MTETTVATSASDGEVKREERAVGELERGDWIQVIDEDGEDLGHARVLHAETYEGKFGASVALMYKAVGSDPAQLDVGAAFTMPLLTAAEAVQAMQDERRQFIADRLRKLADLFLHADAPLPPQWINVAVAVDLEDPAAVDRIAEQVDVTAYDSGSSVSVMQVFELGWAAGISVEWRASKPRATT